LIEKLADMTPEQLMEIPGIGEKMVEKIQLAVAAYFQDLEARQAAAADAPPDELAVEGAIGPDESESVAAEGADATEAPAETEDLAASQPEGDSPDSTETAEAPDETSAPEATETSEPQAEENGGENSAPDSNASGEGGGE
jgi:N utilization substance protein A